MKTLHLEREMGWRDHLAVGMEFSRLQMQGGIIVFNKFCYVSFEVCIEVLELIWVYWWYTG